MGRWIKLGVLTGVVLVVVVGVFGMYTAVVAGLEIPGLSGAFRAEASPPSPEVQARAAQVEQRIDASVRNNSAFFLELTDEDLTALLVNRMDAAPRVRGVNVQVKSDEVTLSGSLNGRVPVPFSGALGVGLQRGLVTLELKRISVGVLPLPGAAKDELQAVVTQMIDINDILRSAGATQIQQVALAPGKLTIVGVQSTGRAVSEDAVHAYISSAEGAGSRPAPAVPGAGIVPPRLSANQPGPELYLALGDSLAANVGVSQSGEGYVARFQGYLEGQSGRPLELKNLGVSGESTMSIFDRQLPQAVQELASRKNDGNPATKVSVLTLDIGANDLLGHLASPECQAAPRGAVCQARIDAALATFESNFTEIVTTLKDLLEPDAQFYVMTVYNPFDFGLGIPFEADSNAIVERMNAIITQKGTAAGAKVADAYTVMKGNAGAWTHMLDGDIHPTADGYQALAHTFVEAT